MRNGPLYDTIGRDYPATRCTEPRIAARIWAALGDARTVLNVFHAYWRRPEAYLLPEVRRGTSVWARVGPDAERRAVTNLRADLESGYWPERNAGVLGSHTAELGARLLVS